MKRIVIGLLILLSGPVVADVVQLGPRPYYLVDQLSEGALKEELQQCAEEVTEFHKSDFSIGHRGAPLQFPEHTRVHFWQGCQI